jgi:Rrf2 family iron-sulfur cluster assembly transcriptional regulator
MLSASCKYAVRAVIYLAMPANAHQLLGIRKISGELGIPSPFLGKILQQLTKSKILHSSKGPGGGFKLGKLPEEIKLIEIVSVMDGLSFFENCVIGIRNCVTQGQLAPCAIHDHFHPLRKELHHLFSETSIRDIIDGSVDVQSVILTQS